MACIHGYIIPYSKMSHFKYEKMKPKGISSLWFNPRARTQGLLCSREMFPVPPRDLKHCQGIGTCGLDIQMVLKS